MWLRPRCSRLRAVAYLALFATTVGCAPMLRAAAGPGAPTVIITVPPLLDASEAANLKAGELEQDMASAQQALELGFLTAAREQFAAIVKAGVPPAARSRAALGLASVEIAAGNADAAEDALAQGAELASSRTRLRRALIALLRKDTAAAAPLIDGLAPESVPPEEEAWVFVAQATQAAYLSQALTQRGHDLEARNQSAEAARVYREAGQLDQRVAAAYAQAATRVPSLLARARIQLARERVLLLGGSATEDDARRLQERIDQFPGQSVVLSAVRTLSALYFRLGRRDAARSVLLSQIPLVTPDQRAAADDLRLMLALVSGIDNTSAQTELRYLLSSAVTPEMRRMALELLANAAATRESQARLKAELDARVADAIPSPVLEDLLLYRARLAWQRKDFAAVEEDVEALLSRFPGSPLRVPARALRVSAAWEQRRYRTAADAVTQLLEERDLDATQRGALLVLQAEAYFHALDFRSAAAAYGAALATGTLPAGTTPGALMFQQVLALTQAEQVEDGATGGLQDSQALLDRLSRDPAFDSVSRWQAEWNLAKALQGRGRGEVAYARVNRLLGPGPNSVPPDLALRMAWLQAKLSLDARQPRETLTHVEKLLAGPAANAGVEPQLQRQVSAAAGLLRAQAQLALKEVDAAITEVARLRRQYPESESAVYSYLALASYYADNDKQDRAQAELQELIERHSTSAYAPYAMYQLAISVENRGFSFYGEAYNRLEDLIRKYPNDRLVFYARMRQGALLGARDEPGAAYSIYDRLLNDFPDHPDRAQAELERARQLYRQWGNDPSRLGTPMSSFERLFDSRTVSVEVRAQAGYMLGFLTALRGNKAEARRVWWSVVSQLLLEEKLGAQLEEQGRYFIGRSLWDYAQLCEEENRIQEARVAYEFLVRYALPGLQKAKERLAAPPTG